MRYVIASWTRHSQPIFERKLAGRQPQSVVPLDDHTVENVNVGRELLVRACSQLQHFPQQDSKRPDVGLLGHVPHFQGPGRRREGRRCRRRGRPDALGSQPPYRNRSVLRQQVVLLEQKRNEARLGFQHFSKREKQYITQQSIVFESLILDVIDYKCWLQIRMKKKKKT